MLLPEGDYRVRLHSSPPVDVDVTLAPRDGVTLTMEKRAGVVSPFKKVDELPHTSCEGIAPGDQMLGSTDRY